MRVLIIEDDIDHIELERKICLAAFGFDTQVQHSPELQAGLEILTSQTFDVCLCDLSFPTSSARETVQQLQALISIPHAPVIALTSFPDESNAHNLLHHGIQDYMLKSELSSHQLRRVVTFAIERQKYHQLLEERNRDQQAFCSSLSHDFRDKICNIKQTSGLLQKRLNKQHKLDERELQWFNYIDESSTHVLELVEGLTTYLRVDQSTAEFEPIVLLSLIEQIGKNAIIESKLHESAINIDCSDSITILGDGTQIYLMLQNLIKNALKFSQPNPNAHVSVKCLSESNQVSISVTDTGIGMDEKQLAGIFEPFHRAHEGVAGTGLGLSIVNRVLQRHAGTIEVQSEPGYGSTFNIRLPAGN